MTVAKADAAILERLLSENGYSRVNVASSARALLMTAPDDTGAMRDRARLVAMPKQTWRVELAEAGRWRDARISGALEPVVQKLLKTGALGPGQKPPPPAPEPTASPEHLDRLERLRAASKKKP